MASSLPGQSPSEFDLFVFKEKNKKAMKQQTLLEENSKKAFTLVLGQCSYVLVGTIKGSSLWENGKTAQVGPRHYANVGHFPRILLRL